MLLAALAGEHILFIGPPGTAKSELGRRLARLSQGRFFERLLTRFSVPEVCWTPSLQFIFHIMLPVEMARMCTAPNWDCVQALTSWVSWAGGWPGSARNAHSSACSRASQSLRCDFVMYLPYQGCQELERLGCAKLGFCAKQ